MDEVLKIALERELVALPMPPGRLQSKWWQPVEDRAH